MAGPLIATRARARVFGAALIVLAVCIGLGIALAHRTTTSFDTWSFIQAYHHFGGPTSFQRQWWLGFTEPAISLGVPMVIAVIAAVRRDVRLVLLAVIGPALALALAELVGKPLVGRLLGPQVLFNSLTGAVSGSYPSGHEGAAVAWLTVVGVVVCRSVRRPVIRAGALAGLVLWGIAGAVGQVVNYHHYATDTIGAILLSTSTVALAALAIDTMVGRSDAARRSAGAAPAKLSSPDGRDLPRTAPGA